MGRSKGKITVEFATIDDLERIVKAMSPDAPATRRPAELTRAAASRTPALSSGPDGAVSTPSP